MSNNTAQKVTLLCLVLLASPLFAANPMINIMTSLAGGGRSKALGEADISRNTGAEAALNNPACALSPYKMEVTIGDSINSVLGYDVKNIAYTIQLSSNFAASINLAALDIDDITLTGGDGTVSAEASYDTSLITIGGSYRSTRYPFQAGLNANAVLASEYKNDAGEGFTIDAGTLLGNNLFRVGLVWAGIEILNAEEYFSLDTFSHDIRLGATLSPALPRIKGFNLDISLKYLTAGTRVGLSVEAGLLNELIALRGAAVYADGRYFELFAGTGLRYKIRRLTRETNRFAMTVMLDYAFARKAVFNQHTVQLGIGISY
jgi:hypothetical protein